MILLPILWGPTFAVVKEALHDISPLLYNVCRFTLAAAIFSLFPAGRQGLRILVWPKDDYERILRKDALVLGFCLGCGYATQTIGLQTTSSSKSAFLTSTTIIWTPLLSWIFGKERLKLPLILAILVTLLGILFLTHPFGSGKDSGINFGDFMTIVCAWSFGIYILWMEGPLTRAEVYWKGKVKNPQNAAGIQITAMQLVVATAILIVAMLLWEDTHFAPRASSIISFFYTGIFATALTAYLQTRYQQSVTPSVASVIYMLEPVAAVIIGYFFLSERLGTEEIIGALLIVVGVVIAQFPVPGRRVTHSKAPLVD